MFANKAANQVVATGGIADAIDFDGTNDYLSRNTDLVGNADGKTATLSVFFYVDSLSQVFTILDVYPNGSTFALFVTTSGVLSMYGRNSSRTNVLVFESSAGAIQARTFYSVQISFDLTNTANRFVYLNESVLGGTWGTYINDSIKFTATGSNAYHVVGVQATTGILAKGRLAHVYLDKQYRDLSVEANRRLFITADRKPAANQSALNPILYLPLNDPTQPGKNLGTGGDFALTGVVARSGRGPSQFNAPYSDLNGTSQYLSRTSAMTGLSDGKIFTFSCVCNFDAAGTSYILSIGTERFYIYLTTSRAISICGNDTGGSAVLNATGTTALTLGRNYVVSVSIDLTDTGKRWVYINGQSETVTWTTYTNTNIDFSNVGAETSSVGANTSGSAFVNGRLGNVFFDTKYIDLSQPANLAKFVTGTGIDAKPADLGANGELPFGTPPLIYLPMYGNNPGKNYGTGGDFTVNGGV